jgi:hypothetical protein
MKKIEDYLYLYLRSGIRYFVFPDESITNGFLERYKRDYPEGEFAPVMDSYEAYQRVIKDGYKPLLRPLASMTEEEAVEMYSHLYPWTAKDPNKEVHVWAIKNQLSDKGVYNEGNVSMLHYIEWFPYLLSRGYDLFNLIPEGLAIDSTLTTSLK